MTIAATRIESFATELAALGCRVSDTVEADGSRRVSISGASVFDTDNVYVSFTPASAKEGKGRRDSLHCMIFSSRKYPRKGYATVEFHEAIRHAAGLKDYTEHAHCEPGRHVCTDRRCAAPVREEGKPCRIPETLHRYHDDHDFTPEA